MTQLSLGEAAKQKGLDAVEMNDAEFIQLMRALAEFRAIALGEISTDELREYAARNHIAPRSPNSWGAILRGKDWEVIGRKKSAVVSNHAREIRVYRYKGGH